MKFHLIYDLSGSNQKIAVKCLPYYADYFGMNYTLPKLDMIAYSHMTMGENVTYNTRHFLTLIFPHRGSKLITNILTRDSYLYDW